MKSFCLVVNFYVQFTNIHEEHSGNLHARGRWAVNLHARGRWTSRCRTLAVNCDDGARVYITSSVAEALLIHASDIFMLPSSVADIGSLQVQGSDISVIVLPSFACSFVVSANLKTMRFYSGIGKNGFQH